METKGEMARQYIAEVVFIYEGISAISDVLRIQKDKEGKVFRSSGNIEVWWLGRVEDIAGRWKKDENMKDKEEMAKKAAHAHMESTEQHRVPIAQQCQEHVFVMKQKGALGFLKKRIRSV